MHFANDNNFHELPLPDNFYGVAVKKTVHEWVVSQEPWRRTMAMVTTFYHEIFFVTPLPQAVRYETGLIIKFILNCIILKQVENEIV